jgi:hypothetical protein
MAALCEEFLMHLIGRCGVVVADLSKPSDSHDAVCLRDNICEAEGRVGVVHDVCHVWRLQVCELTFDWEHRLVSEHH